VKVKGKGMVQARWLLPLAMVLAAACRRPPPTIVRVTVNDRELHQLISASIPKLRDDKSLTPIADLVKQLDRKQCSVRLTEPGIERLTPSEIYTRHWDSVLVMAAIYKCPKCPRWHASIATGFVIADSGVVVTNYHVVNDPKRLTMVAVSPRGKVFPVKEVLAADKARDAVVLQLDTGGEKLQPLAISPPAPVGTEVCVISHPNSNFYMLTRGIVSRYAARKKEGQDVRVMDITADFARGSSGGPVLDSRGAVVGFVASTASIYYKVTKEKQENLQMVFKHCVPSEVIVRLTGGE
jgi:S1-C subfamily serine protease